MSAVTGQESSGRQLGGYLEWARVSLLSFLESLVLRLKRHQPVDHSRVFLPLVGPVSPQMWSDASRRVDSLLKRESIQSESGVA
jgi:hypothetical protein